ncbi:MAG TPA: MOSC N-terminal beta barrel domain-containing protein [Gaiellaceae bacterium]|nr:MOSC N-terminal beta barrel domain-containing protein [Gaiellaceae bacterium]
MSARVAWISVAPVKGMALEQRDEVLLEPFGVRDNRRFHVVADGGRLVNGKQIGELQQVAAIWDEATRRLVFRFPDGSAAEGMVELGGALTTNFYGRDVEGRLVVGPWSEALTSFVGRDLRLVQPVDPGGGLDRGRAGVSILSTGSLEAMREAAGTSEPIDPRRFRMLFGVDGVDAHEEDAWVGRRLRIGSATVAVRGNVGRCIVTSRHPDTGVRNLPTLDLLAEYRHGVETTEPLPFGIWAQVEEPGRVTLGDAVEPI